MVHVVNLLFCLFSFPFFGFHIFLAIVFIPRIYFVTKEAKSEDIVSSRKRKIEIMKSGSESSESSSDSIIVISKIESFYH